MRVWPAVLDLIIAGTNGSPGGVRAFDARTGAKVWDFRSVPQPGELGNDTWNGESWKNRAGTYSWAFSQTTDAARGILYVAIEGTKTRKRKRFSSCLRAFVVAFS